MLTRFSAAFGLILGLLSLQACLQPPAPVETVAPPAGRVVYDQVRPPPRVDQAVSNVVKNKADIHTIKHVVIIMQENRSFDNYFGTYPGADGIPMENGVPSVCVKDPVTRICIKPFHDPKDENFGGPHGVVDASNDVDGGKMDGFIEQAYRGIAQSCKNLAAPACVQARQAIDVMGYHDAREIPNYWEYAHTYVLQDHMFEPSASWTLPEHLFMVSAWSAKCATEDPMSCRNDIQNPDSIQARPVVKNGKPEAVKRPDYAWTDLTYLLHQNKVSWAYYVAEGTQPDCEDDSMFCEPKPQTAGSPQFFNPLPYFVTVRQDKELGNIQTVDHFYQAARQGTLPAVAWIVPNGAQSEHAPSSIKAGMNYVTGLVNAIMSGPDWAGTAIFISWDDWGGFYDHVVPPKVDQNGYGLRVPGLVISPYAKKGYIDHQTLSFDAYLKFIEDDFLGGRRIDPQTDGRPDPRPGVRENSPVLGDLVNDFDFAQSPRPPLILEGNP